MDIKIIWCKGTLFQSDFKTEGRPSETPFTVILSDRYHMAFDAELTIGVAEREADHF
jgi:hypothetical protein